MTTHVSKTDNEWHELLWKAFGYQPGGSLNAEAMVAHFKAIENAFVHRETVTLTVDFQGGEVQAEGRTAPTDYERMQSLMDDFGLPYAHHDPFAGDHLLTEPVLDVLTLTSNGSEEDDHAKDPNVKLLGYNGFFAKFAFDREGKFVHLGLWE